MILKRALLPALLLAALVAVPALSQGDGGAADLATEVARLKEKVAQQEVLLAMLQEYHNRHTAEAAALVKAISRAEKAGVLLPTPNVDAKKDLLAGLFSYAHAAAGSTPPAPEAAADSK